MRGRIRLKKRRIRFKKSQMLIISIVFVLILSFALINKIGGIINVKLMDYASVEVRKVSTTIVNYAVNDIVMDDLRADDLFVTSQNKNGDIQMIDFNASNVNKLLNDISQNILDYFDMIEEGNTEQLDFVKRVLPGTHNIEKGIIMEIPTGLITGNSLLANIGPKIPVKIMMVGDLESNISTDVEKYGINNAIITVNVNVVVCEQIILPMYSKQIAISNKFPIAMKVIQGIVPNYYLDGLNANSFLYSLPMEKTN